VLAREIKEFKGIKDKARAYLCYLISSNLSYGADINSMEDLVENLESDTSLTLKKAIYLKE